MVLVSRPVTTHLKLSPPLFDPRVDGFGELFRQVSFQEIGTSTIQSRALAGLANRTLIACMPGSPNACRCAWDTVLRDQLDNSHGPCNFVQHLTRVESKLVDAVCLDTVCDTRT